MNSTWIRHLPDFMRDSVAGRYNLQRLIGNTGWLLADRILRLGVGLFVGVWIARYLGPDQYGLFNYAGAIVGIFSIIATLGLDGVIVRQLVNDGAKKDEIIGAALFVFLGVAQGPWDINEGLTKLALARTFSGAVANIGLNLLLIPRYGPAGASGATTLSYAMSAVLLNACSSRTRGVFRLQLNSLPVFLPGTLQSKK